VPPGAPDPNQAVRGTGNDLAERAQRRHDVRVTWTAPEVTRIQAPLVAGEREALEAVLDYQRDTLLMKCSGLTAQQLRQRAVPPSGLSLLGLVRHMTDVERWWFRVHAGDQDMAFRYFTEDNLNGDFDDLDTVGAPVVLASFREEVELARVAVGARSLDDVVPSHGDHPERVRDIRWIYVHMIEEYARHNGHADLIRERIDGVTGD
jgi:hypothetical protein